MTKSGKFCKIITWWRRKYACVTIPVVFAGGVYAHEDILHYLSLGCAGVQMATRFVVTEECDADPRYKQAYLNAKKEDITIMHSPVGMPGRAIRNPFLTEREQEREKISHCYQCLKKCDKASIPYCITTALARAADGDTDNALLFWENTASRSHDHCAGADGRNWSRESCRTKNKFCGDFPSQCYNLLYDVSIKSLPRTDHKPKIFVTHKNTKGRNSMSKHNKSRSSFSGKIGYVLAAAGASVGLGNIWRFPYLAAKYGGGIFLLIYILLALTFGYSMIVAESAIGRMTRKSPVGAFQSFGKSKWLSAGGWINAIIPILIVPYYSVIGGWVIKYLIEYVKGNSTLLAEDGYFSGFISNGVSTELCFAVFCLITVAIIYAGVRNGIERVSKVMMPILIVLSVIIAVYSVTRPGALAGVKYFLVPNLKNFSWMSVVAAMGQMFYSLSIAMGILITFGSYMKKDTSIEDSTRNVEIFDTAIAIMAGLMIIPAVFAFSGGDPDTLQAGPSLMFITIPKVFANMGFGTVIGILFFLLVLFAALTSSIALTESAVSTFEDELGWGRKKSTVLIGVIMIALGTLSCLGYGPLSSVTILGMQFLDFFDFLTNSVMMPIAAIATCLLVSRVIGVAKIEEEIIHGESRFRRKKIFLVMIQYLCPVFALIILFSSVANAFGWITM